MKKLILFASILFFSSSAFAQTKAISRAALWGGYGFDMGTTFYGIRNDHRREANPILGKHPAQIAAVSGAFTFFADYSAGKIEKQHPRQAKVIRFIGGALHIGAGFYNIKSGTKR